MSAPGDVITCWGDFRYGIVLSTSRHKRVYDRADADKELRALFEDEGLVPVGEPEEWQLFSHTTKGWQQGFCDCGDPTWFCTEGDGQATETILAFHAFEEAPEAAQSNEEKP